MSTHPLERNPVTKSTNYFDVLTEWKCNLDLPNDKTEFIDRINDILKILDLKIDSIKSDEEGYITIIKILNTKYLPTKKELTQLYDYFSYKILGVIQYD